MFHKIVWLRFLFGVLFCSTSILLLVSCGRSDKQVVNPILVDTLSEEKSLNETNNNLQSKSRTNLPYVLPIEPVGDALLDFSASTACGNIMMQLGQRPADATDPRYLMTTAVKT